MTSIFYHISVDLSIKLDNLTKTTMKFQKLSFRVHSLGTAFSIFVVFGKLSVVLMVMIKFEFIGEDAGDAIYFFFKKKK